MITRTLPKTYTCISYYELRQIRVIRRTLSLSAAAVRIHSFVLTRLDYCNGVLLGLPEFRLHQLQLVQNAAARLLTDLPKYSHISDYMRRELHCNGFQLLIVCNSKLLRWFEGYD